MNTNKTSRLRTAIARAGAGLLSILALVSCGGGGDGGGPVPATVTVYAGALQSAGNRDGAGAAAQFNAPADLAQDAAGNVYVADARNHTIRRVAPDGTVTTLAGAAGLAGTADGTGANARFSSPGGITIDAAGTLYVSDTGNRFRPSTWQSTQRATCFSQRTTTRSA